MNEIEINNILNLLNDNQKVVGASKTRTREEIEKAYQLGIRDFGENYVQELIQKYKENDPFNWHFIGRIQTNKIKDIVSRVSLIHGVYRLKEVQEIDKQSKKINKISNILIEVNLVENDETHGGIKKEELDLFLKRCVEYKNIKVVGFMIIGPNSDDLNEIEKVFIEGEQLFLEYKRIYPAIKELSMGMSYDYKLALKHNATYIRIGTNIFGKREYKNKASV